jgi:membrane fusion protein (multidrug efflux system)
LLASPAGHAQGRGGKPGAAMPPTTVEAVKPTVKSLADAFKTVGSIKAGEVVTLKPEVDGKVEAILFEEGQTVAKGAPLFRLDPNLARADVAEADANAANSSRELKRAEEMVGRKLISQADFDKARMQANVDAAKLDSTRVRLAKTEIHAPFAGVISLRKVSPGAYVKAGDALVDLVQLDPLKLDFSAPEALGARLAPGQAVQVMVEAFPNQVFSGKVYAIAPQVELTTRSIAMRANLPNPGLKLKPGQFAQIALEMSRKDSALLIPEQALWPQGAKQFVYVVKDGKADLREIKTGQREPGMVEVLSGIDANDLVVIAGQLKIGPGAAVQPIDPNAKPDGKSGGATPTQH